MNIKINIKLCIQTPVAKLDFDTEKWEDENNPIVKTARDMAGQMRALLDYLKFDGPLQVRTDEGITGLSQV